MALSLHSEDFKALAMTPAMLQFLVTSVTQEAEEYLARWATGWKSKKPPKQLSSLSSSSLSQDASSSLSEAVIVDRRIGQAALLMQEGHTLEQRVPVEQGDKCSGGETSDDSWKTDDDAEDDGDDNNAVPAGEECAPIALQPSHAQSPLQDWEACEHRCVAHLLYHH